MDHYDVNDPARISIEAYSEGPRMVFLLTTDLLNDKGTYDRYLS